MQSDPAGEAVERGAHRAEYRHGAVRRPRQPVLQIFGRLRDDACGEGPGHGA